MAGKAEVYCQSCGELIKVEAEICPKCGVRQKPTNNTASNNGSKVFQYFVVGLKKFNKFSGRARRAEFWWFYLFIFIATWIIQLITNAMGIPFIGYVAQAASLVPTFAVAWRRMHDIGKSGAYSLIPIYGIILCVKEGDKGPTNYGPDPKEQL
jgi:uncharacterized membrane protein YhaH (DUF805 family)